MTDTHTVTEGAEIVRTEPSAIDDATGQQTMHPLVQMAMHADQIDTTALEKMMVLQLKHEANEARKAFARARVQLDADLPTILAHDKEVKYGDGEKQTQYTHTSLAAALRVIRPHLTNYGFNLSWKSETTDTGHVRVTCRLLHVQGHFEIASHTSAPDKKGGKNAPQAIASSQTMLQRYTALGLLGIATEDMGESFRGAAGPPLDTVNSKHNIAANAWIGRQGLRAEDFVAHVDGRTVREWTAGDLIELKLWAAEKKSSEPAPQTGELTPAEEAQMDEELDGGST